MNKIKTDFLDLYQENNSEDSPRTADSISNSGNSESTLYPNEIEIDISKRKEFIYKKIINDENQFNLKIDSLDINKKNINNIDNKDINKDPNKSHFFKFKLKISIILSTIYLVLFLMNIPNCAIKTGQEKKINNFLESNGTGDIHILINNFHFSFSQYEANNTINNNKEITGFLLEFRVNKKYVIRWIIGFLYFIIRNICFIYTGTQKNNENSIFKNKIDIIQKLSCLLFPLFLFYYDIKNNTFTYKKIKNEYIGFKTVNYYIRVDNHSSINNYIETIIPTFSYFLISLVYNGIENNLIVYIKNRKKVTKLV